MATASGNLTASLSLTTDSLYDPLTGTGAGQIAFDPTPLTATPEQTNEVTDYIRYRLGDGMVDVDADKEHYLNGLKQALLRYRQKSSNSVEESYAFLEILPETQEYILPRDIMNVRAMYRRGAGSITGNSATQFEPFASGYLNTYMLANGRVGGLATYELFAGYQELTMKMFGGYIQYTFNRVTKKLTLTRKMPSNGRSVYKLTSLSASGTTAGSVITFTVVPNTPFALVNVNDVVTITDCGDSTYNGSYLITSADENGVTFTVEAQDALGSTSVTGTDLTDANITSIAANPGRESVLLHLDNFKPDQMLLNDNMALPWIQDYALAIVMISVGNAREKFATIAGPQGGTSLNGAALKAEGQAMLDKLDEEIKNYADGGNPLTWTTG